MYKVSEIAKKCFTSAQTVNETLVKLGYQTQTQTGDRRARYEPTTKGRPVSSPYEGKDSKGRSYTVLSWSASVQDELILLFADKRLGPLEETVKRLDRQLEQALIDLATAQQALAAQHERMNRIEGKVSAFGFTQAGLAKATEE
jgi:hypothetical protein